MHATGLTALCCINCQCPAPTALTFRAKALLALRSRDRGVRTQAGCQQIEQIYKCCRCSLCGKAPSKEGQAQLERQLSAQLGIKDAKG